MADKKMDLMGKTVNLRATLVYGQGGNDSFTVKGLVVDIGPDPRDNVRPEFECDLLTVEMEDGSQIRVLDRELFPVARGFCTDCGALESECYPECPCFESGPISDAQARDWERAEDLADGSELSEAEWVELEGLFLDKIHKTRDAH
jgi:hypothetical protein